MKRRVSDAERDVGRPGDTSFGEMLRGFRLAADLSQEALADRSGVSVRTISDLERGVRTTPQSHPATLIADALGLAGEERDRYFAAIRKHRLPRGVAAGRVTPGLPAVGGPILGRDAEIALVERCLAGGDRIVTLTGPGGVGKTRLALEVASRREGERPGSIIWVALDLLQSPAGVLPALARACGVRDRGSGNLPARIAEALADRDVLIVLDNAEHVVEAMAVLPRLLAAAPCADMLITSREDARVRGERIVRVEPLPVPRREDSRAVAAANPAVALYLDRLGASATARAGDEAAIDEAATVVRLLDGLPLAIELAAAQAIALPRSVLPGLLEAAGLAALAHGRRDGHGRFRTMDAAIAWSVDLLPPGADRLLRLLGIFRGGFTAEAASAVTAGAGSPESMAALPALANAQLVLPAAGAAPRFRLLEPVRLYARERLRASGEEERVAAAHAAVYLAWGREQAAAIDGPDPVPALAAVEADLPNLRAAIAWATEHGDPGEAIATAVAMRRFFDFGGYPGEFRAILDAAIAAAGPDAPPARPLLEALFWAAIFANMQGDPAASGSRIAQLRDRAAAAGSTEFAVRADLAEWGRAGASAATRDAAGPFLRRALETLGADDASDTAWMLRLYLGVELQESGDPAPAIPLLERTVASAAERRCALDQPLPLARLGLALLDLGREEDARARLEESLAISVNLDAEVVALFALLGLARLDAASPDPDGAVLAARRLGAADAIVARQGLAYGAYWEGVVAAIRERLAGTLGPERLAALLEAAAASEDLSEAR